MTVVEKSVVPPSLSMNQKGLVSDLDLLVGFFAELQVCLDAQSCDTTVAKKYFQPYATRLYCVHEPFIVWKNKAYSQRYGDELKKLALPSNGHC